MDVVVDTAGGAEELELGRGEEEDLLPPDAEEQNVFSEGQNVLVVRGKTFL